MEETVFPASLALRALRATSYKNTAYAVAELVDNSFDAGANQIGVALLVDDNNSPPHTIAVLDNGRGMANDSLRRSIQYGFSGRDSARKKPLGKFGVGLVSASFSQCSDLQVMSWQDGEVGSGTVPSTGIRLVEDLENRLPVPSLKPLPDWAGGAFVGMATPIDHLTSGSLVIWREVEPSWKRANTLVDNLIDLCGRIYRNFIASSRLTISVGIFNVAENSSERISVAAAVDPTFLTNWKHPWLEDYGFVGDRTLFDPYTGATGDSGRNQAGDYQPQLLSVKTGDGQEIGACLLTASYRSSRVLSNELREKHDDPGDAPYGRLAQRLQGVSILRSEREIDLDPSWLRLSRTVDRWVSVSLDFDPDLDEAFGVTNDKQKAHRLAEAGALPLHEINDRIRKLEEEERGSDGHLLVCLKVAKIIKQKLAEMQRLVSKQRRGQRTGGASDNQSADPSSARIAELVDTGTRLSEGGNRLPQDETAAKDYPKETAAAYEGSTSEGQPAKDVRPPVIIQNNLKVDVVTAPHELSRRIFRATLSPGHMVVHLNERHSLYGVLSRLLLPDEDRSPDEPEPTLEDAFRAIRSILISYARAQAEASDHEQSEFERCAVAWGEVAERVFKDMDE